MRYRNQYHVVQAAKLDILHNVYIIYIVVDLFNMSLLQIGGSNIAGATCSPKGQLLSDKSESPWKEFTWLQLYKLRIHVYIYIHL